MDSGGGLVRSMVGGVVGSVGGVVGNVVLVGVWRLRGGVERGRGQRNLE